MGGGGQQPWHEKAMKSFQYQIRFNSISLENNICVRLNSENTVDRIKKGQ